MAIAAQVDQPVPISSSVTVHPFETAHVIPSLGYVLTSTKKKLKPSLLGLPGPEIKRLKDAGEVCIRQIHPHLFNLHRFMGPEGGEKGEE